MLSKQQRWVLECVGEKDESWFTGKHNQAVRSLQRKGLVSFKREWRFGGWQYAVKITPAGRAALEE